MRQPLFPFEFPPTQRRSVPIGPETSWNLPVTPPPVINNAGHSSLDRSVSAKKELLEKFRVFRRYLFCRIKLGLATAKKQSQKKFSGGDGRISSGKHSGRQDHEGHY
jgi:hypothetical protein